MSAQKLLSLGDSVRDAREEYQAKHNMPPHPAVAVAMDKEA